MSMEARDESWEEHDHLLPGRVVAGVLIAASDGTRLNGNLDF